MAHRLKGSASVMVLATLLAACAARQPQPRHRVTRVVQASPTPTPPPTSTFTPLAEGSAAPRLEESNLEDTSTGTTEGVPEAPGAAAIPNVAGGSAAAPSEAQLESLLGRITPQTPPNVAAALRLIEDGRTQLRQAHYDQALERFERAVAIDPTNAYGYYFLAQLHYETQKYDQAIAFAGRAAALAARNDRACLGRAYSLQGVVFEKVGRYADARRAYQRAVEADPSSTLARSGMARLNGGNP